MLLVMLLLLISGCRGNPGDNTPIPATSATTTSIRITPDFTDTPILPATETRVPITRTPPCDDAPMTRLIIQERGRVTDNGEDLNLRRGPGTDQQIIERIEPGEIFLVLDGPTCSEEYVWYQINYRGTLGWIAEGDFEQYYTEPYLPG